MGVGSGRQGDSVSLPPLIFILGTDKVEEGLTVLFFGLVFSVAPSLEIFLSTPLPWPIVDLLLLRLQL